MPKDESQICEIKRQTTSNSCTASGLASSKPASYIMSQCFCMIYVQVGIDLIGPLPLTKKGNKYVVTLVDYFSKWPEAAPLPDKSAIGVGIFLYELFCRYR